MESIVNLRSRLWLDMQPRTNYTIVSSFRDEMRATYWHHEWLELLLAVHHYYTISKRNSRYASPPEAAFCKKHAIEENGFGLWWMRTVAVPEAIVWREGTLIAFGMPGFQTRGPMPLMNAMQRVAHRTALEFNTQDTGGDFRVALTVQGMIADGETPATIDAALRKGRIPAHAVEFPAHLDSPLDLQSLGYNGHSISGNRVTVRFRLGETWQDLSLALDALRGTGIRNLRTDIAQARFNLSGTFVAADRHIAKRVELLLTSAVEEPNALHRPWHEHFSIEGEPVPPEPSTVSYERTDMKFSVKINTPYQEFEARDLAEYLRRLGCRSIKFFHDPNHR